MRVCGLRQLTLAVLLGLAALAAPAPAHSITVSPTTAFVTVGADRRLTAYANGAVTTAVTWSVNGIAGGNATVGFIDSAGKYTAPAVPPAGWTVTATATQTTNPPSTASCLITVRHPVPWLSSISPSSLEAGAFALRAFGSRFVPGAVVRWNGAPVATTFNSSSLLTATGAATATGSVSITVANPGPGAVSATLLLNVRAARTPTRPPSTRTPTRRVEPTRTNTVRLPTATFTQRPEPTRTFTLRPATPTSTRPNPTATNTTQPSPTRTATMRMDPSATSTMRLEPTRSATPRTSVTPTNTPGANQSPSAIPTPPPTPDPLAVTYGRFLEQSTFGPTKQLMAHIAQIGISAFLDEQFAMPESPWPPLATAQRSDAIDAFFGNALAGPDQLRQRVIYALSEIIVEASNKNTNANEIIPWLQLLSRNAFGNYRTLLAEITLDASMGKYLDLANSGLMGGAANENYPREVMQLFSMGLYQLNLDGSVQVDAQNVPIPTYSQVDVQQLAKALTGWTFGNPTGTPPTYQNSNYYPGPMLPVASKHNATSKTLLGDVIPANQSAQQDLDDAIDIIFYQPNVGPFICTRLIRALITSNPSPGYVARVAAVFNDNGAGVRGDMRAVLTAILLDAEARNDTPPANFGRLRTPVQHTIALVRALSLNPGPASQFAYLFTYMNESMLDAPSVFGHYSPSYRIPRTALYGPEFQIYSVSDAINRANFFYSLMYQYPTNPLLQPFLAIAGNATALVDAVDSALLFGRMAPATRAALLTALPQMPDNNARMLTALYLTSMSGEYLIQR